MNTIRSIVAEFLSEAKKKKKDDKEKKYSPAPESYGYADSFDFSQPLDMDNRLKAQGDANFGPYTSAGQPGDKKLRAAVREAIMSEMANDPSPWDYLSEAMRVNESKVSNSVWDMLSKMEKGRSK